MPRSHAHERATSEREYSRSLGAFRKYSSAFSVVTGGLVQRNRSAIDVFFLAFLSRPFLIFQTQVSRSADFTRGPLSVIGTALTHCTIGDRSLQPLTTGGEQRSFKAIGLPVFSNLFSRLRPCSTASQIVVPARKFCRRACTPRSPFHPRPSAAFQVRPTLAHKALFSPRCLSRVFIGEQGENGNQSPLPSDSYC